MAFLSYNKEAEKKRAERIQAVDSASGYLDDDSYFEAMVIRNYPHGLPINISIASNTEAPFLDLYLSTSHGFVPSKI